MFMEVQLVNEEERKNKRKVSVKIRCQTILLDLVYDGEATLTNTQI